MKTAAFILALIAFGSGVAVGIERTAVEPALELPRVHVSYIKNVDDPPMERRHDCIVWYE